MQSGANKINAILNRFPIMHIAYIQSHIIKYVQQSPQIKNAFNH